MQSYLRERTMGGPYYAALLTEEFDMIEVTGYCMLILILIGHSFRPVIVPRLATS